MNIHSFYLILETKKPVREEPGMLRGYFANKFPQHTLLHQHVGDTVIYSYPKVQYKIIGGTCGILGINDGATLIRDLSPEISSLTLFMKRYQVTRKIMFEQEVEIKPVYRNVQYQFLSPWLALNKENYQRFCSLKKMGEKTELLNRILIGNILSMAKGLGVVIDREIFMHSRLDPIPVWYKGTTLVGYTGAFRTNVTIPEYFGIGKGVSEGFGTVSAVAGSNRPRD